MFGHFDLEVAVEELFEDVVPGEGAGVGDLDAESTVGFFDDAHVADDAVEFFFDISRGIGDGGSAFFCHVGFTSQINRSGCWG